MQADLGGLLQLMSRTRPKDLSGIAADLSPNFWDNVTASTGLMMLKLSPQLQRRLRGVVAASMANVARAQSKRMRSIFLNSIDVTTIMANELALLDALDDSFDLFLTNLAMLQAAIRTWAMAPARQAARTADMVCRQELAADKAKGGGTIWLD